MSNQQPLTSLFERVLDDFKKDLSQQDAEDFKFTRLVDLQRAIVSVQNKQASERRMKNLGRLQAFLEAMKQFDEVVKIFANSSEYIAFVWGPVKFLLLTANTHVDALTSLLETYEEIGENLPMLKQYEEVFKTNPTLHRVLAFVYSDILKFHQSAMKSFRGSAWKKLFNSVWKTHRTKFDSIIRNLQRHQQLLAEQASLDHFQQYQDDRLKFDTDMRRMQEEEDRKRVIEVRRWLNAADSERDQKSACLTKAECPGSGQWLMDERLVKRWISTSSLASPFLWVTGKPGAGKTILASSLIDTCQNLASTKVVFFYSKYNDPERNSLVAVLRGILAQLLGTESDLMSYIFERDVSSGENVLDDFQLALELLEVVLSASTQTIYLILDGLDECAKSTKDSIVKFCRSSADHINGDRPGGFRCCIFSQDDTDTGALLKDFPTLRITSQHNGKDILAYCAAGSTKIQADFGLSDEEVGDMANKVALKADGMFIYATLVMRNLSNQPTKKALRKEVEEIPEDLDKLYERIMDRVLYNPRSNDCKPARKLLGWLACATRPLRWHEIQCAISYDPDDHVLDMDGSRLRLDPKRLCGSFVDIHDDQELRLVHLTVVEFLRRKVFTHSEQDLDLACLCLNYLCLDAFGRGLNDEHLEEHARQGTYAFMHYALVSWPVHVRRVLSQNPPLQEEAIETLKTTLKRYLTEHPIPKQKERPAILDKTLLSELKVFQSNDFRNELGYSMKTARETVYLPAPGEFPDSEFSDEQHLKSRVTRISALIERLLKESNTDESQSLQGLYGFKMFKCPTARCLRFYDGFLTEREREDHFAQHERPYKCLVIGCAGSYIGFPTQDELEKHNRQHSSRGARQTFPWHGETTDRAVYRAMKHGYPEAFSLWLDQLEDTIPEERLLFRAISLRRRPAMVEGPLQAAIELDDVEKLTTIMDRARPGLVRLSAELNTDQRSENRTKMESNVMVLFREAVKNNSRRVFNQLISTIEINEVHLFEIFRMLVMHKHDDLATKLLEHPRCPSKNAKKYEGRMAQYMRAASHRGRLSPVRYLIEEKGSIQIRDSEGITMHLNLLP